MSRRAPMMLAAIAVMVALFATAAYAAVITGTAASDVLIESQRNDTINGRGGGDDLRAGKFEFDTDDLNGGTGADELIARDADNPRPVVPPITTMTLLASGAPLMVRRVQRFPPAILKRSQTARRRN